MVVDKIIILVKSEPDIKPKQTNNIDVYYL